MKSLQPYYFLSFFNKYLEANDRSISTGSNDIKSKSQIWVESGDGVLYNSCFYLILFLSQNSVNSRVLPAYSWKQMVSGDLRIFSSKRSFLFRKRIIEVSVNHLLLQIESNSFKLSCIRFCRQNDHQSAYK